jgi:general secretion pathway protein J
MPRHAFHQPRRAGLGFTLVEVLVALVVMSILAGLAWQAVDAMVRSRAAVEEQTQRLQVMGTALAQWEQDLQGLLTDAPIPAVHFDGARLRLTRRVPQGVQLVVWSLRQGVWQRWAGPITNQESALAQAWAQVPQMQGREPGHVTLAEGVSGWQVYFFRGNAWANAQSTGDLVAAGVAASQGSQALPNRERLPQGVRLMLTLQGPSGNGTLTRDVLVPGGQP